MDREQGLIDLLIAVYDQCYADYNKAKKEMLNIYGEVVEEDRVLADRYLYEESKHRILRYFEVIRFFCNDPYGIYGGMEQDKAIDILNNGGARLNIMPRKAL